MVNLRDYVASGYFLSRHMGGERTGLEARPVTLAHDHSRRSFFPETWTLSWCRTSHDARVERAAAFGISETELDRVMGWADQAFDVEFGAWDVFFTLEDARTAARAFLQKAADLELWGVGLHGSLVSRFCTASAPPSPEPGYAPQGASALHVATCVRARPLDERGTLLGHEILISDIGCTFNSPESRHLDAGPVLRAAGIVPNLNGLIDSFDEALTCCRSLDAHGVQRRGGITGWLPWLVIRYPLEGPGPQTSPGEDLATRASAP